MLGEGRESFPLGVVQFNLVADAELQLKPYSASRTLGFMGNKNRISPSNEIPGSQVKVVMHPFMISVPIAAVCLLTWGRVSVQIPAALSPELSILELGHANDPKMAVLQFL